MKSMTPKQKATTKQVMIYQVPLAGTIDSNLLVLQTVTHLPFANKNHARGILSDLVQKGILKLHRDNRGRGIVSR